ncbi:uncharacterized protein LOC111477636 [Cucurbita maxima]|uniref:Uncharacterized protein LOC111477636 n=1 Tax=Cucurbita maxima TaxID=3661 RepID=A0A6J1IPG9_CUCMA|nr:uncharacterized protein LOC111477636 [Cucurbita maxima]
MPQGDLQAFLTGGVADERKAATADADDRERMPLEEEPDRPEVPPDFPPESFWLSKDAEFDWFDRNAFLERKESTKASSNSTNLNPNLHTQSNSNSQRFSLNLKSKASIIGLPKPQNTTYVDAKNRRNCKSGNIRLFPKRSGSGGKSVSSMIEPSSPKVSCMGRVRSKKDRNRQKNNNHHHSSESEIATNAKEKPVEKQRKGFFASFRAVFRNSRRRQPVIEPTASSLTNSPPEQDIRASPPRTTASLPNKIDETEPPSLGGLERFTSSRRSSSWSVNEAGKDVE